MTTDAQYAAIRKANAKARKALSPAERIKLGMLPEPAVLAAPAPARSPRPRTVPVRAHMRSAPVRTVDYRESQSLTRRSMF